MSRIFNFSAGPAMLPAEVLSRAGDEMLDWHGSGMSVMEMSHRGKEFIAIAADAEKDLRELLAVPANYKVLFLAGGATLQFAQVPMNLLRGVAVVAAPTITTIAAAVATIAAVAFELALLDALEAGELLALVERDQGHALGGAALLADLRHRGADQHAAGGDQHHLVVVVDQHRADQRAVALGSLDRDHALAAAAVARVLGDRRALAEAVLGRRQHRL